MGVAGIDMREVVKLFRVPKNSVALMRPVRPGEWVNGRWENPEYERILLRNVSVQPISGEERQSLPEAARTKDVRQFFLMDTVQPLSQTDQRPADQLEYEGRLWEPLTDGNWNENANYWDVIAVRVGQ